MEEAREKYTFTTDAFPKDLPADFKVIAEALSVIIPIANSIVTKYAPLASETNLPVYEFKGVDHKGKHLLNLFDYELI